MNEHARLGLTGFDLVDDAVEGHLAETEVADRHAQHQEGGRHPPGHRDLDVPDLLGSQGPARDHDRAVAGTHAGPVRKQEVAVLHEGVRVQRDRRRLQAPLERPLVQGLDVGQDVLELETARVDAPGGERPEHERVVGVWTVAEADQHGRRRLAAPAGQRVETPAPSGLSS